LNRKVFSSCQHNELTDDVEMTLPGSAFQILAAAATGNTRLPIMDSLNDGTRHKPTFKSSDPNELLQWLCHRWQHYKHPPGVITII